ncbi:MAG: hypothetical protein R2789_15015 [Microthrixaceae bacterium]
MRVRIEGATFTTLDEEGMVIEDVHHIDYSTLFNQLGAADRAGPTRRGAVDSRRGGPLVGTPRTWEPRDRSNLDRCRGGLSGSMWSSSGRAPLVPTPRVNSPHADDRWCWSTADGVTRRGAVAQRGARVAVRRGAGRTAGPGRGEHRRQATHIFGPGWLPRRHHHRLTRRAGGHGSARPNALRETACDAGVEPSTRRSCPRVDTDDAGRVRAVEVDRAVRPEG